MWFVPTRKAARSSSSNICWPWVINKLRFWPGRVTSRRLKIAWPAKVLKGDTEPGFTIDLAHKDLTLIIQAGNAAKVPMPVAAAAREAFSAARAQGFGARDFSAMVDVLCELAGIDKPRLN